MNTCNPEEVIKKTHAHTHTHTHTPHLNIMVLPYPTYIRTNKALDKYMMDSLPQSQTNETRI